MIIDQTELECKKKLDCFLTVCKDMGVPMAQDKTFQPSQVMTFVGYESQTSSGQTHQMSYTY